MKNSEWTKYQIKSLLGSIAVLFLIVGSTLGFAQTVQHVLLPGEIIEIACATSEPCPTCAAPTATDIPPTVTAEPTATGTNTPEPTSTSTNTPVPTATSTATPMPTNTPQPQAIRFGPMDLTANGAYSEWSDVFDLARDFHYPEQALANEYTLIIPVILSHSRCMTDGIFDYAKCRAEVLRATALYADACRGEDCVWYVYDEPHDPRESNPTYPELDGMCQAAKSVLDVPCGYNAPAEWMAAGAPYQYVDMSLSQTNFGRASSEAEWALWANETMDAAQTFADTIYLSFNSETYEPSAADYAEAMAGICSAHPDGVTFWSFRMPHTQATMTHAVAASLRQVCNGE